MKAARVPEELKPEHSGYFCQSLLAINTGMLAILASNAPPVGTMSVLSYVLAGIAAGLIAASLWFLSSQHAGVRALITR